MEVAAAIVGAAQEEPGRARQPTLHLPQPRHEIAYYANYFPWAVRPAEMRAVTCCGALNIKLDASSAHTNVGPTTCGNARADPSRQLDTPISIEAP